MNRYLIGAFWSARVESREDVAERTARYLHGLSTLPRELSAFYKGQWTRKTPLKALPTKPDELASFLGQYYTNVPPRQLMPQLGYRLIAWNGIPDDLRVAKLQLHCGAYSDHVGNSVVLEFNSKDVTSLAVLRHLMQECISAFDPDSAVTTWATVGENSSKVECLTYERRTGLRENLI